MYWPSRLVRLSEPSASSRTVKAKSAWSFEPSPVLSMMANGVGAGAADESARARAGTARSEVARRDEARMRIWILPCGVAIGVAVAADGWRHMQRSFQVGV